MDVERLRSCCGQIRVSFPEDGAVKDHASYGFYMSAPSQWYVRLPNGNVITVSLDQLDAGFQRGDIDENTLVFKQGMKEWLPLGAAAGLDDEVSGVDDTIKAPTSSPHAFAPASPTLAPYAQEPDAYSVRPVAFDMPSYDASSIDVGDDYPAPKSGKKKVFFAIAAVAAVIGLGIVGVTQVSGGDAAAAAAAIATQAPANAAAAVAPPAADPIPAMPVADNRLSDDQKKALMKLDDKTKSDQAKKAQDRADRAAKAATKSSWKRKGKGKEPFVKGGNQYDPLNASL
jgi:hypothetical protein